MVNFSAFILVNFFTFVDKKTVLIIQGGPGTGKSVIAINLLAALSSAGFNAHYATGSKAVAETTSGLLGSGWLAFASPAR